jgi:hypothetical protein
MCATLHLQGIRGNSQDAGRFAEFSVESRAWAVTEQPSASESDWRSLSILSDSVWREPLRQMQLDRKIVFCIQSGREPITPPWGWVYFQQVSRDGGIGVPYRTAFCLKIQRTSKEVGHFLFRCFSHVFETSVPPSSCHPAHDIAKTCRRLTPL